jgi:hypothetical protein
MQSYSVKEVSKVIGNKSELYEAAIRNGYFLPKFKCTIITEEYLNAVLRGELSCAKYHDIRLKPCPVPPDKESLIKILEEVFADRSKPLGIDASHTPDKDWLLAMISTFDPENEIFHKSYVPPTRKEKKELAKGKVALPADFLVGLPERRGKGK